MHGKAVRTGCKSRLLFISPFMPSPSGGGSPMRAYHTLLALSSCFAIDLLVFPMGLRRPPSPHPEVIKICSRVELNISNPVSDYRYWLQKILARIFKKIHRTLKSPEVEICPALTPHREKKLLRYSRDKHFHTIHIFRLAVYPVFAAIRDVVSHGRLQLDLDDIESDKWLQISRLHRDDGNVVLAETARLHAAAYRQLEKTVLPATEEIFVCSARDRTRLEALYQCRRVTVLPNVYILPENNTHIHGTETFRLLFVGSLGYPPNADAILFFCSEILPELRKITPGRFELRIIGDWTRLPGRTRAILAQLPEITLLDKIGDVGPFYLNADAAVVPLRAGSGTRLKILEAFARQVPVVSTLKGIEGLEVTHGQHVLIGDTPADFARQCVKLMNDPALGDHLVQNARSLVASEYSPDRLIEILCR